MPLRLAMYARYISGMPGFLRQRMTPEAAREIIRERIRSREENFLALAEGAVFSRPSSPYQFIMRDAGCEPGDVRRLVRENGLDAALATLFRAGLRISYDEFKGRKPIVRGGRTLEAPPEAFDNPLAEHSYETQTSGSTGRPLTIKANLAHIASQIPMMLAMQDANGHVGVPHILYRPGMPCNVAINTILRQIVAGNPVRRWFSPVTASSTRSPLRFRVAEAITPTLVRACGAPFPRKELLPFPEAVVAARAAAALVQSEGACVVRGAVSTALTMSLAARDAGIDLTGVTFGGGGEPPSPAKLRGISASGAKYATSYSMTEAGTIGAACCNGADGTDVHFARDRAAVVQAVQPVAGLEEGPGVFHYTTLLPTAPKIMINVSSDDFGILEERECGCRLGELGLNQHIRQIRSVGKLTGRGITLVASDITHIIEDVLPSRFGGTLQDYQLVEEEDADGSTHLTLLVSPHIGLSDDAHAGQVLLDELSRGNPGAALQSATLRSASAVRVKREKPRPNARGKLPAFRTTAAR